MWHWGKKRSRISPWSHFVTDWNFRSIQICEVLMGTVWTSSITAFHLRDGYYHIARKSICFDCSLFLRLRYLFILHPFICKKLRTFLLFKHYRQQKKAIRYLLLYAYLCSSMRILDYHSFVQSTCSIFWRIKQKRKIYRVQCVFVYCTWIKLNGISTKDPL